MNNYKKIEIVGKGSFGYAVLVQSVLDGNYYIMKVYNDFEANYKYKSLDYRCFENGSKTKGRSSK